MDDAETVFNKEPKFSAAWSLSIPFKLWYFGICESTRFTRFKEIVNYCVWSCYQNIILRRNLYGNCKRDFQYSMEESFIPRNSYFILRHISVFSWKISLQLDSCTM